MLTNYLTLSLRHTRKRKLFAGLTVLGMAVGIAACLLIAVYVSHELSYDRFHADADRLYQVGLHSKLTGYDVRSSSTCPPLGPALTAEIPEVDASLRLVYFGEPVVRYADKSFIQNKVWLADSNFFRFFSFPLLAGNVKTVLAEPYSVVLTESIARSYFGNDNPVGKLITFTEGDDKTTYTVTGVAADCPANSHFQFNILVSSDPSSYFTVDAWLNSGVSTYLRLRADASAQQVEKKMERLVKKYAAPELQRFLGSSVEQFLQNGGVYRYYTTPVADIHLRSTSQGDPEPGGSISSLYFFAAIGVFIIVIACINFMNMSTAQSAGRAKEVGVRKTLGSGRRQMMAQFLTESMLYSLAAVILGVVFCYVSLPAFNLLAGKKLSFAQLLSAPFMAGVLVLWCIVGLLAGSYPAFYLSSFRAVDVLKGNARPGLRSKGIRSTLVVFQFAISIFLLIFTAVVYSQIRFMQQQPMGIDKQQVMVVENVHRLGNNMQAFRDAVAQQSGVDKVSFTAVKFPRIYLSTLMRNAHADGEHRVASYYSDYDSQDVLKFEMKEGRYFSRNFPSDSNAVVINEAAARAFGFTTYEGQEILYSPNAYVFLRFHVIGIMKDFAFESYREQVRPLAVFLSDGPSGILLVRYNGNVHTVVANVEQQWKRLSNDEPFAYTFMDENFGKLFRAEQRMGQVLGVLAALAIFIACLGLFALTAFTTEQRTKEIGIRKVLGASVGTLSLLLTKDFIRLVVIAFVPASALAAWGTTKWLEGFAYRVEIDPWIFVMAGVAAILVATTTVIYQAQKAATKNPVESIRYE